MLSSIKQSVNGRISVVDLGGLQLKQVIPIGEYSRLLASYRLEFKDIYDVGFFASENIKDQEGTSTASSITTSYSYNTTDNRLDPILREQI